METDIIRADTADVIAYAFYQIGYRPRESLVLVGLRGVPAAQLRTGLVTRMDLPLPRHVPTVLAAQIVGLRRFGNTGGVALVISDWPAPTTARGAVRLPHRALVRRLTQQADRQGWPLKDVIAVGQDRWRSYLCDDPECCPATGRPLEEITSSPVAAWMISQGRVLESDERALVADVEPVHTAARATGVPLAAAESLRRWRAALEAGESSSEHGAGDPEPDVGWLPAALQDRWLRDAVLLTLIPGAGTAPEEVLAGADPEAMDGLLDRHPDHDLLERGRVLLAAAARGAPAGQRADPLALLAWAAWWSGEGARARLLADRATSDQPDHRLGLLVNQLLVAGVAPGWVARSRAG
jgi:hypothetical protein